MKKVFICLFLMLVFISFQEVNASCSCGHCSHSHGHSGHNCPHSSHGSSSSAYVVRMEQKESEEKFPNCNKHYMKIQRTTYYYSDGTTKVYINSTIYNNDGTVLASDCNKVNHILYQNNHYFVIRKNKGGSSIIDSYGETLTQRNYSKIEEINENRFLVKFNKKYGIIDIKDNIIVPIKYQKFKNFIGNIYITKYNGYFGILDTENNILVKNDCEKIKPLYNTIIIKRYGKYGLCDSNGKVIYNIEFDKIKNYGDYIVLQKNKEYQVLDSNGKNLSDLSFEKVKFKRNTLYGYVDKKWVKVEIYP